MLVAAKDMTAKAATVSASSFFIKCMIAPPPPSVKRAEKMYVTSGTVAVCCVVPKNNLTSSLLGDGDSPPTPLLVAAISALGSTSAATAWLRSPQRGLGGARPVDFAEKYGDSEVLALLGRVEHGVYS